MTTTPTMSPLEAYRHVMTFASRRGEAALRLALHAAVPQVLRPELLHLLRLNFVPESAGDAAVEADVLFASFCEDLGNGYFRFDEKARLSLLAHLDSTYGDRLPRSRAVAAFLLRHFADYDRTVKADGDSIYGGYIELERWSALAFFDPDVAAEQLAEAVRRSAEPGPIAARIRVAGLASTLATPLARHQKLLAYAAGIEALQAGAARLAPETLESLGDAELTVGGVTLPSARVVLRSRAMAPETSPRNPDAPATESRRADDEARKPQIFISYHHLNRRWADWFKTAIQHSSPNGIQVGVWVDGGILPGVVWTEFVIARLIEEADAAMVLLTADYLTSEHCMHELSAILERVDRGEMELSWVLLSACDWVNTPVARYAAANRNASLPLDKLPESEQRTAVASIADDLVRRVLRRQTAAKTGHHGTIYLSAPTTAEAARLEVAIESQGFRLLRAPHDEAAHAAGSGLVERLGELHEEVSPRVERMAEWLTKALAFLCVVDQEGGAGVDSPARARPLQESEYVAARTAGIPIYVFMPTSERGERQGGGVGEPTGIKELTDRIAWQLDALAARPTDGSEPDTFRARLVRRHEVFYFGSERELDTLVAQVLGYLKRSPKEAAPKKDEPSVRATQPGGSFVFVGHTIDRGDWGPRFPPSVEEAAREAIRAAVIDERKKLGADVVGFASGSDGGDILFHEVCMAHKIPAHLYLPVPVDEFISTYVAPAGVHWVDRFRRVLTYVSAVRISSESGPATSVASSEDDAWQTNAWAMLKDAGRDGTRHVTVIALWDGKPTESPGGPTAMLARANTLKIATRVVPIPVLIPS